MQGPEVQDFVIGDRKWGPTLLCGPSRRSLVDTVPRDPADPEESFLCVSVMAGFRAGLLLCGVRNRDGDPECRCGGGWGPGAQAGFCLGLGAWSLFWLQVTCQQGACWGRGGPSWLWASAAHPGFACASGVCV